MPGPMEVQNRIIRELFQINDGLIDNRQVRWIELTRDLKRNALSTGLLDEMTQAITDVPQKAIFISSRGKTFSGGLDLDEMQALGSAEKPLASLIELYTALVKHPSPTACLVERGATAGGVGLALCTDAVVMSCNAWITLPGAEIYRPLAKVLFPVVQARRAIKLEEFEKWYGRTITAGELLRNEHIDSTVHPDNGRDSMAKLMQAAVEVLEDKTMFGESALSDRIDSSVFDVETAGFVVIAIEHSKTKKFQNHLRGLDPPCPENFTISWLIHGVPIRRWLWLVGILATTFTVGIAFGKTELFRLIINLMSATTN